MQIVPNFKLYRCKLLFIEVSLVSILNKFRIIFSCWAAAHKYYNISLLTSIFVGEVVLSMY